MMSVVNISAALSENLLPNTLQQDNCTPKNPSIDLLTFPQ